VSAVVCLGDFEKTALLEHFGGLYVPRLTDTSDMFRGETGNLISDAFAHLMLDFLKALTLVTIKPEDEQARNGVY
jgi:hypothetical protein